MFKETILITGTKSGLGKYLHKNIPSLRITRDTSEEEWEKITKEGVGTIIHCAANSSNPKNAEEFSQYVYDNILLTEKLLKIPHHKFIFISTIDVYPKNNVLHNEEEEIESNKIQGVYTSTKYISEVFIQKMSPQWIILRCSALLGEDARKNSMVRILDEQTPTLTVSANSEFNYILHKDFLKIINEMIRNNVQGIYNCCSNGNITLSEIAKKLKKEVTYGEYYYKTGKIDNSKLRRMIPELEKTSLQVVEEFIQMRKNEDTKR